MGEKSLFERVFLFFSFLVKSVLAAARSKISPIDYETNNPYLTGPFSPVKEELQTENLHVLGEIPADLNGQFVRNGPNPRFKARGAYHWFDGDGMLHGTYIKSQTATYTNKWVRTQKWIDEEEIKSPLHFRLGDFAPESFLPFIWFIIKQKLGFGKTLKGRGGANTALTYHDRRLLALEEDDLPYHIISPSLETVGRYDFHGKLKSSFTAHPKIDPDSGELVFFGYNVQRQPYCRVNFVDSKGILYKTIPVELPDPVMMHDFALTKNYVILLDFPLIFSLEKAMEGKGPLYFNDKRSTRIGILPRTADSQKSITWLTAAPGFMFHVVNSWEDDHQIILLGCREENFSDSFWDILNYQKNYSAFSQEKNRPKLYLWKINLTSNSVEEKCLDTEISTEFPTIPENLITKKISFAYAARMCFDNPSLPPNFDAIVKYNLSDLDRVEVCGTINYGPKKKGGECVFAPRKNPKSEDDGYLMTYVFDEENNGSELWIMDALTMNPTPLARIQMPARVPYGFHGHWVSEERIQEQRLHSKD